MPERTYNGPHPEVEVALPGGPVVVKRGSSIEVDADTAKGLDEQGDTWLTQAKAAKTDIPAPGKE